MSKNEIESLNDADLRSACKEAGIKCAPLSDFSRKYYKKKLSELAKNRMTVPKSEVLHTEKENLSKEELEKLPNSEFAALMEKYKMKKAPLTESSKKLFAKKIYLKMNNLEAMEWETDLHEITDENL
ncbi:unnamed protein product [Oikopleura dioica]|uniref:LEM domain-containing protein n=1 Tax=Oikopleura dioica TaxID=34765 RepID=E4WTM1_OIKDI|nr:unnamed protein product [Oikopleura dioica]